MNKLITILILLLLCSCVTKVYTSDYCLLYKPINPKCPMINEKQKLGQDTQDTCRQIDELNIIFGEVCK